MLPALDNILNELPENKKINDLTNQLRIGLDDLDNGRKLSVKNAFDKIRKELRLNE